MQRLPLVPQRPCEQRPEGYDPQQHRRHARVLTVSTQELTLEIQLQQLMAMSRATPKELKLMLARDFIYTKVSFVGAAKYRKLKKRAKRLLTHFQHLYGSKTRDKKAMKNSSQRMIDVLNVESHDKATFKALVDSLASNGNQNGEAGTPGPSSHFEEKVLRACRSSSALLGRSPSTQHYDTVSIRYSGETNTGTAKTGAV